MLRLKKCAAAQNFRRAQGMLACQQGHQAKLHILMLVLDSLGTGASRRAHKAVEGMPAHCSWQGAAAQGVVVRVWGPS